VSEAFPSVNWLLPEPHAETIVDAHARQARWSLKELAKAKNQSPPDPTAPLVPGTLHEALETYEEERRQDFTLPDGSFDGSGHHMLGMIRATRERINDFPLPHKGDKLLYRHYSNKPWAALFKAQRDYREHPRPMFAAAPDPLTEYDPVTEKVRKIWAEGERSVRRLVAQVGVSGMAVRRRLKALGLAKGISGAR
jgi:hypothetical protein